jgi:hypothetical protein
MSEKGAFSDIDNRHGWVRMDPPPGGDKSPSLLVTKTPTCLARATLWITLYPYLNALRRTQRSRPRSAAPPAELLVSGLWQVARHHRHSLPEADLVPGMQDRDRDHALSEPTDPLTTGHGAAHERHRLRLALEPPGILTGRTLEFSQRSPSPVGQDLQLQRGDTCLWRRTNASRISNGPRRTRF